MTPAKARMPLSSTNPRPLYALVLSSAGAQRSSSAATAEVRSPSASTRAATDSLLEALEAHPEGRAGVLLKLPAQRKRPKPEIDLPSPACPPKAEYYDAFVDLDCTNIRTTAMSLGVPEKQRSAFEEARSICSGQEPAKASFSRAVKKSWFCFCETSERARQAWDTILLITLAGKRHFLRERMKFCLNNAFNPSAVPSGGDEYGKRRQG